jgi:hypothetical protein
MEGSKTKSKPDCRRAGHFYAFAFFFSLQLLRKLLPLEPKRRWAEKRAKGEVYMDVSRFSLFFYVCIRDCWWMVKSFHLFSPLALFRGCGL